MKNKGQALVEFILILPLLILIITGLFDFGNIIFSKTKLENEMDNIINLYRKNEPLDENVKITKENEKVTITLTKNIKLNTPILNKILSNKIETKRVIYDE
mgnify:CR=1 FL=1